MSPSPYWGEEVIWDSQTSTHNPMYDEKGQVWFTSRVGPSPNPDFCKKGSDHPSAKVFPMESSTRHLAMVDPKSGKITLIRTCYQTHHLVFAEDANNTLWMSAGGPGTGALGWLNRKMLRGDRRRAEGAGLDADRARHQRQRQARRLGRAEPAGRSDQGQAHHRRALRHRRQSAGRHDLGLGADLSGLRHPRRSGPESVARPRSPRSTSRRRRATARAASTSTATASPGCRSRAATWQASTGSKCKGPLNGPATATGRHCPEGWTLYPFPGPQMQT